MINTLLSAEAGGVCGSDDATPSPHRTNFREGSRARQLDTRVGAIDLEVPKLRQGTCFPDWLLERRKRSGAGMIVVVADAYLPSLSTRSIGKLVKALGIHTLSKSQVHCMATDPDEQVTEFCARPLDDAGSFTLVVCDALTVKDRERP